MILYVNCDSQTAAAEAVNPHAFAEDDPDLFYMGRAPHPANLAVSWGRMLSSVLKATFKCDAESASSNTRILRTTREWLGRDLTPKSEILAIIQWSTWEREEWLLDDVYYQITASGTDDVPSAYKNRYKQYVSEVDWNECTQRWHDQLWNFHQELNEQGVRHIFFNGNNHFAAIDQDQRHDWKGSYLQPYDPDQTYRSWLLRNTFNTVAPNSWHFGRDAHAAWSRRMLQYIVQNNFL